MNLEQHRMQAAYVMVEAARKLEQQGGIKWADWKPAAMSLGANVQRCGLLQAIVFLLRDPDSKVARALTDGIRDHLADRTMLSPSDRQRPLLDVLRKMDGDKYMLVTREVLCFTIWIKRATQQALDPKAA